MGPARRIEVPIAVSPLPPDEEATPGPCSGGLCTDVSKTGKPDRCLSDRFSVDARTMTPAPRCANTAESRTTKRPEGRQSPVQPMSISCPSPGLFPVARSRIRMLARAQETPGNAPYSGLTLPVVAWAVPGSFPGAPTSGPASLRDPAFHRGSGVSEAPGLHVSCSPLCSPDREAANSSRCRSLDR